MAIAINPVFPVVGAQETAAVSLLQPGTVIDATVLKQLDANLVRIAIASLSIDVLSEVPLQAGQALQLAVSQTPQGVRLQIVPGGGASPQVAPATDAALLDTVSVPKSDAPVQAAASGRVLTNLEALAVSAAVQTAAARQGSLSPLFANLNVAASSQALPQTLQQAAAQLLAQRTPLGENLTGDALKTAFRNSGLFFEQNLAGGSTAPDLKAALIVFRQTLASWLGNEGQPAGATPPQPSTVPPSSAPPLSPETAGDVLLPQGPLLVADEAADLAGKVHIYAPGEPLPTAANRMSATSAGLTELQELLQGMPKGVRDAVVNSLAAQGDAAHVLSGGADDAVARTNVPPPPFRGSETTAQSVALPQLSPDDTPATVAHRLIEDTDAALARQTLLQAASLPADTSAARTDPMTPRWNFEIPFVTPQGTAVAQFEISRDGGNGTETEAAARIWRARFSLDVEPSGPVHALVSLSKGRTSVRMWAERPATAAQLRVNAPQLSHALREAALEPGDIVIGEGTPPKPAAPPAGHFLDRAS